jgi:parvulin-like peptidyl-prolyl isomerase
MLRKIVVTSLCLAAYVSAQPQSAPAAGASELPPETVVATLNGKKFTAEQVRKMVAVLPSAVQLAFKQDPKQFLRDHAWYLILQDYALKNKLEELSPLKEQLEFSRLVLLSQAAYNHASLSIDVTPDEQRKYYAENSDVFREAKVRMIYIPFSDLKTEGEAKAKADAISKKAKAGEDFGKLVKENSADSQSAENGGDLGFAVRLNSSQPPPPMRRVILSLKQGEVTDALRHDNGYYVFRVESIGVLPFEKVRDEIYKAIQEMRFRDWERKAKSQATVQFDNEVFFQTFDKEK